MAQEPHITEGIDRYLKGQLEGEALAEMEQRIAADAEYAAQVAQRREFHAVIGVAGREVLRDKFKTMHREMEAAEPPVSPARNWRWMAIAATVLLLLIPAYFWFSGGPASPSDLYAAHFQPGQDRLFSENRGGEDLAFSQAMDALIRGDYAPSVPVFAQKAAQFPDSLHLRLCHGVSLVGQGKVQPAQAEFQFILDQGDSFVRPAAAWYAGLAALKADQPARARTHLVYLSEEAPDNAYAATARKILKQLE